MVPRALPAVRVMRFSINKFYKHNLLKNKTLLGGNYFVIDYSILLVCKL